MSKTRLILSDFVLSFTWVWSGVLIKICIHGIFGLGSATHGEFLKGGLSIINMFFFAFFSKITNGASYNPLTVLPVAVSGDLSQFLFTFGARIPAQVYGSIIGVGLIINTFPEIGLGPRLNTGIHHGALTEGALAFVIVSISLGLSVKIPGSFYAKTWISSVSKLTLHILGSDLTGGCMNPASVMGWAYARGDHITKEHLLVYWVAPFEATLLAVLIFKFIIQPVNPDKQKLKDKSD